jgi:hypothetical protein
MPTDWSIDDLEEETLDALLRAARMAEHLRTGGRLQPLTTGLILDPEESAYLDEQVLVSQYIATVPRQERPWSMLSAADATRTAFRNWVARTDAQAQWRDPFLARTVLTDSRVMMSADGTWTSCPHQATVEILPEPTRLRLVVAYEGLPPIRMSGVATPSLAVALVVMLGGVQRLATTPGLEVLDDISAAFG